MSQAIEPGLYRHFKGGQYDVIGVATGNPVDLQSFLVVIHSTEQEMALVIYVPLDRSDRRMRFRSVENFTEHVEKDDYSGPRFTKIFDNQTGPA